MKIQLTLYNEKEGVGKKKTNMTVFFIFQNWQLE